MGEYVDLFRGKSRLQQLEMALALTERVLTGTRDKPYDRQVQAAAADQMWRELGPLELAQFDPVAAIKGGWLRVANLVVRETPIDASLSNWRSIRWRGFVKTTLWT